LWKWPEGAWRAHSARIDGADDTAAARQARELLEEMRLDVADRDFASGIADLCAAWSGRHRSSPVRTALAPPTRRCTWCHELNPSCAGLGERRPPRRAARVYVRFAPTRRRRAAGHRRRRRGFRDAAELHGLQSGRSLRHRRHDGTRPDGRRFVSIDSIPGAGTTVTARVAWVFDLVGRPMTIGVLVVDDNPIVRSALLGILASSAGRACPGRGANGREALQAARRLRPDVTLLDHRMPIADGLSVLQLRSLSTPPSWC